jgi:hypothetical protein
LAAWDTEEIAELLLQLLAAIYGQELIAELGLTAKDLACCLALFGLSTLDYTPTMQDMEVMILCHQLCRDHGPDDAHIYSCDECNDPDKARAYISMWATVWNETLNDYLHSDAFIEALKECIGASDNPIGKVI